LKQGEESSIRKLITELADEEIEILKEKSSSLFMRREQLDKEIERYKQERDSLNESVRVLQERANAEKEQRDAINKMVAELKSRLRVLRRRLEEKRREFEGLDEKLEESRRRLRSRRRIEDKIRSIEWKLSTTPTLEIKNVEAELIERVNTLREELRKHEKLDSQDNMYVISLAEVKAIQLEIKNTLKEMKRLHWVSQDHHEKMIALYRKSDEERDRADESHKKFVKTLKAVREINKELNGVLKTLREQKMSLRKRNLTRSLRLSKMMQKKKSELTKEARKKLEAGEKLTLEEMKLIYGEE
jgi:uncharacterized coiled-coil DUF342 family protein